MLEEDELFARRFAAINARSLLNATVGAREGPAMLTLVGLGTLLAAAINFWWSLYAEAGSTLVDGTLR